MQFHLPALRSLSVQAAIESNLKAVAADLRYKAKVPGRSMYVLYFVHNYHMLVAFVTCC